MSLTSSRVRAVNAVFEAGSFSHAARRLGVTQPAVTQQVRSLESEFGVSLFERRGNDLVPTALCREFAAVTSQMSTLETQALAVLRQKDALKGGELRIGLGNSMPGMALISSFCRLYSNIQITVEMGNWASIIDAVVNQGSTWAFCRMYRAMGAFVARYACGKVSSRLCIQVIPWPEPRGFHAQNLPGIG